VRCHGTPMVPQMTNAAPGTILSQPALCERFPAGLPPSIRLHGLLGMEGRVPTFAFSVDGISAAEAAARLGERGFAVWQGNYYALEVMKRLGLEDEGGAVRVGFVHCNTAQEVDLLLDELARLE
jgi:selenocysteine lyase/cysteine desulfurase